MQRIMSAEPCADQVAVDRRVGEPQVRLHGAAALRHAVHLALLDVQPVVAGRRGDDRRDREHALAADAGENDVASS